MTGPPEDSPTPAQPSPAPAPTGAARTLPPANGGERRGRSGWADYLRDPRSAVLSFLAAAFLIGGGRKAYQALQARRAVAALAGTNPDVTDVEAAADHGRVALIDLFRLLGTADRAEVRTAAGRALARLWKLDALIPEEEKGIVRRGFAATWHARRKYPRDLPTPIPIRVDFGVPFLSPDERGVGPDQLAWSYRLLGTERARLAEWTEVAPGSPTASFSIFPNDFTTLGPHRLALHARVKTVGLTDAWELELPHLPFSFEFDPHLRVDALLTLADEARSQRLLAAIWLEARPDSGPALALTGDLMFRDPPLIRIQGPLPCDLAHRLALEVDGIAGVFRAGSVVAVAADLEGGQTLTIPLSAVTDFPTQALDRPGPCQIRVVLTADPSLGWTDPAVRSIWPGTITTDWVEARLIRA